MSINSSDSGSRSDDENKKFGDMSYNVIDLYHGYIKNGNKSNLFSTVKIKLDNDEEFIIFSEIWKEFLTVPLNPFTKQFHSKFYFDIDGNGLSKDIFHIVNSCLMTNDIYEVDNVYSSNKLFKKIFVASDNLHIKSEVSIKKMLIYLGIVKFIITHFNVKIVYSLKGEIVQKTELDNKYFGFIYRDLTLDVNPNNFTVIEKLTNAFIKMMNWIGNFLMSNYTNYDEKFIKETVDIIKETNVDLYPKYAPDNEDEKINKKQKSHNKRIKNRLNSNDGKKSWKREFLKRKPKFGIIEGYGTECQSTIEQLFPTKIAMFINTFFTKGIIYVYEHMNQYRILTPYEFEEKLIHESLFSSTQK